MWLRLGRRVRRGIPFATDALHHRGALLCSLPVLFVEVSCGIAFAVLPVPFLASCRLGRSPRFAHFPDELRLGNGSGSHYHCVDASSVERQRLPLVELDLGIDSAGLVFGRNCPETEPAPRCFLDNVHLLGGHMAAERTLSVNGAKRVVSSPPETPLLFVLRNELQLTGPKMGCGMAQCGACAVLLDGEEVRTCITPLSYAEGKQIITIEGLPAMWAAQESLPASEAAKTLHPVQQAGLMSRCPNADTAKAG